MIRRHNDMDIYVDGTLILLRAMLTEDTSNQVLTVTVRDVAGPNMFTQVLRVRDFVDEGEQNRIRFFSGVAETIAPPDMMTFQLAEPTPVALSAAPRAGGGCGCNG